MAEETYSVLDKYICHVSILKITKNTYCDYNVQNRQFLATWWPKFAYSSVLSFPSRSNKRRNLKLPVWMFFLVWHAWVVRQLLTILSTFFPEPVSPSLNSLFMWPWTKNIWLQERHSVKLEIWKKNTENVKCLAFWLCGRVVNIHVVVKKEKEKVVSSYDFYFWFLLRHCVCNRGQPWDYGSFQSALSSSSYMHSSPSPLYRKSLLEEFASLASAQPISGQQFADVKILTTQYSVLPV